MSSNASFTLTNKEAEETGEEKAGACRRARRRAFYLLLLGGVGLVIVVIHTSHAHIATTKGEPGEGGERYNEKRQEQEHELKQEQEHAHDQADEQPRQPHRYSHYSTGTNEEGTVADRFRDGGPVDDPDNAWWNAESQMLNTAVAWRRIHSRLDAGQPIDVVVVGGSVALGATVGYNDTWGAHLVDALNAEYACGHCAGFKLMNMVGDGERHDAEFKWAPPRPAVCTCLSRN